MDSDEMLDLQIFKLQLTQDDVIQFINEKAINHSCPVCGMNNWGILTEPDVDFGLVSIKVESGYVSPGQTIPLVLLMCENCGHFRPHSKYFISRWKFAKTQGK